jgi:hypothetical protein
MSVLQFKRKGPFWELCGTLENTMYGYSDTIKGDGIIGHLSDCRFSTRTLLYGLFSWLVSTVEFKFIAKYI